MRERIFGLETEYGMVVVRKSGIWDSHNLCLSLKVLPSDVSQQFLMNGGRAYCELSNFPEYATAECSNLKDLIAQYKAGDRIIYRILSNAMEEAGAGEKGLLFKNNVSYVEGGQGDDQSNTFGCHENFLIEKKIADEKLLARVLVPFLVARQIISGSGWVADHPYYYPPWKDYPEVRYAISQRTRFIGQAVNDSTRETVAGSGSSRSSIRPILCTGRWNEGYADASKHTRFHIVSKDSNMSELSAYLSAGSLAILLEMIEEGMSESGFYPEWLDKLPRLHNSVMSLHLVACDPTCKKPVIELADHGFISVLDLFWTYIEIIDQYRASDGLNPELADVLEKLKDMLARFEKREIEPVTLMEIDSQGLNDELDWLIKKTALEDNLKEAGRGWNNFFEDRGLYDDIRRKDLNYHDVSPTGFYNSFTAAESRLSLADLKKIGIRTPRVVEEERVALMEINPPDTRAKVRSGFIRFAKERGLVRRIQVDWNRVGIEHPYIPPPDSNEKLWSVTLTNPFASDRNPAVELLKKELVKTYGDEEDNKKDAS